MKGFLLWRNNGVDVCDCCVGWDHGNDDDNGRHYLMIYLMRGQRRAHSWGVLGWERQLISCCTRVRASPGPKSDARFRPMVHVGLEGGKNGLPKKSRIVSMTSYMWLQTADGLIQQVEQDVALFCPFIRHTMLTSGGSSEAHPIILPETVTSTVLGAILDYCQFHHLPGRSNLELKYFNKKFIWVHRESLTELLTPAKSLQMTQLVDLLCGPLVKLVEISTDEEIRQAFGIPDDITEEDKWTPIQINTDNSEVRLFNKLCARKRKEIKQKEKMKNVEVEAPPVDNRSIDDLMSFINGENEGVNLGLKAYQTVLVLDTLPFFVGVCLVIKLTDIGDLLL
ncbi:SKP1-like protein 21 [Artemisia annua]|uniref:SKP1-like protein 21 n=1 Tax=Artemisia annua TaxID=35608 RepID=A0A2U1MNS6_ARTAN|nr:SKP1-like protein 21 [Artemisia annua]